MTAGQVCFSILWQLPVSKIWHTWWMRDNVRLTVKALNWGSERFNIFLFGQCFGVSSCIFLISPTDECGQASQSCLARCAETVHPS